MASRPLTGRARSVGDGVVLCGGAGLGDGDGGFGAERGDGVGQLGEVAVVRDPLAQPVVLEGVQQPGVGAGEREGDLRASR